MSIRYQDLLNRLIPIKLGGKHDEDVEIEARYLEEANSTIPLLLNELFGDTCTEQSITDWERVYDLTPASTDTIAQRRAAIVAAIRALGGLSKQYFIDLMDTFGETITIEEFQPFKVGVNKVGEKLYPADIMFFWRVTFTNRPLIKFKVGINKVGEKLQTTNRTEVLEDLLTKLKPAHTMVGFTYP